MMSRNTIYYAADTPRLPPRRYNSFSANEYKLAIKCCNPMFAILSGALWQWFKMELVCTYIEPHVEAPAEILVLVWALCHWGQQDHLCKNTFSKANNMALVPSHLLDHHSSVLSNLITMWGYGVILSITPRVSVAWLGHLDLGHFHSWEALNVATSPSSPHNTSFANDVTMYQSYHHKVNIECHLGL